MTTMYCIGAYGRDYQTVESLMKDWASGKDFRIYNHSAYTSSRDVQLMKDEGYTDVVIYGTKAGVHHSFSI